MKQRSRVLILTSPVGGGHEAVARAAAATLSLEGHEVVVASPLTEGTHLRRLGDVYARLITTAPLIWSLYYHGRERFPLRRINASVVRRELKAPLGSLEVEEFDAVLLTSSIYMHCIGEIAARAWTAALITDLFGGPPEWFLPGADAYIVPTEEMRLRAIQEGVPAQQIWLQRLPTLAPTQEGPSGDSPRVEVMVVGGASGFGPIFDVACGFAANLPRCRVTAVCGHNRRLLERLRRIEGRKLRAVGYIPRLASRLRRFDVVVTKPGSVTLMEALEAGRLLALMPGIPGIEDGNEARLVEANAIPLLRDYEATRAFVRSHFTEGAELLPDGARWRRGVKDLEASLPPHRMILGPAWQRSAAA